MPRSEASLEKRKAYNRQYRKDNPEKVRLLNEEWKKAHPEYEKKWRKENPERHREYKSRSRKLDRKELKDWYVREKLAMHFKGELREFPQEMIDAKREDIKARRLLKQVLALTKHKNIQEMIK